MEVLQKHRTSLFNAFSREFSELDRGLRAELARRVYSMWPRASFVADHDASLGDEDIGQTVRELRAEVEQHRIKASRADELETENQRLRQELTEALASRPDAVSRAILDDAVELRKEASRGLDPAVACTDETNDKTIGSFPQSYDALLARFKLQNKRYLEMKHAHDLLMAKSRRDKERFKGWKRYLDRREAEWRESRPNLKSGDKRPDPGNAALREQERQHVDAPASLSRSKKRSSSTMADVKDEGMAKEGSVEREPDLVRGTEERTEDHDPIGVAREVARRADLAGNVQSPESTQGEPKDLEGEDRAITTQLDSRCDKGTSGMAEAEPDLPVVVSERALKRKRPAPPGSKIEGNNRDFQDGTPQAPITVKSEHGSSSPAQLHALQELVNESIDLDEVGWKVKTPRKRARLHEVTMLTEIDFPSHMSRDGHRPAYPDPHQLESPSHDENLDPETSGGEDFQHREKWRGKPKTSNVRSNLPITVPLNASFSGNYTPAGFGRIGRSGHTVHRTPTLKPDVPSVRNPQHTRASGEPLEAGASQRLPSENGGSGFKKLLQPKSNNMKLSRPGNENSNKRVSCIQDTCRAVGFVSEDGEAVTPATSRSRPAASSGTNMSFTTPEQRRSVASTLKIEQRLAPLLENPSPDKRELTLGTAGRESVGRRKKRVSHGSRTGASATESPVSPRLRGRPLDLLTSEDFRINPNYNQGHSYAFVETVRNQDQRRCLPGCTRPECCGNIFRRTVQLGGLPAAPTSGLRWNSSPVEDEDEKLLADFLGDDVGRLQTCTEDERQELLLQARTKLFADKHGRHRQAYERRTTPPGFWRADMPTTQELEADRQAAKQVERAKVEERYREAMRPGGKWIYRDE